MTAAHLLKKKGFDVSLFERSPEVGGNIKSARIDGYLIEHGPNSLLRSAKLIDLIDDLGLRGEVVPSNPAAKKRYILLDGELRPMPMGPGTFAFGDFFSFGAKIRLAMEPFIRTKARSGESAAEFFERRLGREVVEKAVDPFIAGIYAGDSEKLSIRSAFPKMFAAEQKFGSLVIGRIRAEADQIDNNFPRGFTFRNGLQTLSDRLAESIGSGVAAGTSADRIRRGANGKFVVAANGQDVECDAVIVSTKAGPAADLLGGLDDGLAASLREIRYPPVVVVRLGYRAESFGRRPDGFGFLIPRSEKRKILGCVWNSSVYPDRAPEGRHLLTAFVGGTRSPELFDLSDDEIFALVHEELAGVMSISSEPEFKSMTRWKNAIPQYNIGYEAIAEGIENFMETNRGIYLCSNFYGGISVGDCIKNAYRTAEKISGQFQSSDS